MSNKDLIHRFLFDSTDIRGEIVSIKNAFQDAVNHQNIPPALLPLFGEFLTGAALLSEVLKFEGILTLQAHSEGDIAIIMAEATDKGDVRGILTLNPSINSETINFENKRFSQLLEAGVLTITIDPNKGNRYQGMVPMEGSSLSSCLENYFQQSEQLPTQIQIFSDGKQCGGLFLQCLPAQLVLDTSTRENHWQTFTQLAATITAEELFTLKNEDLLLRLFHEFSCRVFEPKELQFKCSCTKERSAKALQSIGYTDAISLLKEKNTIDIDCQFCGKLYLFFQEDLGKIFPKEHSLH